MTAGPIGSINNYSDKTFPDARTELSMEFTITLYVARSANSSDRRQELSCDKSNWMETTAPPMVEHNRR